MRSRRHDVDSTAWSVALISSSSKSVTAALNALKSPCQRVTFTSRMLYGRVASVCTRCTNAARMSSMLCLMLSPRVPPKTGSARCPANCSCALHTSSRSAQRCTKASTCANIGARSWSHGAELRAVTRSAVRRYSAFHAAPASMDCCSVSVTASTAGEKTSARLIAAQQRPMISLDTCSHKTHYHQSSDLARCEEALKWMTVTHFDFVAAPWVAGR